METAIAANSPATETGEAKVKSGNLNVGQAAVQLLASMQKAKTDAPSIALDKVAPNLEVQTPPETTTPTAEVTAPAETTEPEVAAETTEAVTTEPEVDVPSQNSFTPEQQEILNKRIAREVAKTKAKQAQLEADYQAKVAELQSKTPVTAPEPTTPVVLTGQPLAEINDSATLNKLQQTAKEAIRYVEDVLEDPSQWKAITIPDGQGGEQSVKVHAIGQGKDQVLYTEADLRAQRRKAKVTLEDHIPQRAQFLNSRTTAQQEAYKAFPFLTNKSSSEYQMVEVAKRNPANAAILSMPNADYALGLMVEGQLAIQAREAAKGKPVAPVKPKVAAKPPSDQTAVSASTAPSREPAGNQAAARRLQAQKDSLKKGNINPQDAAKLLIHN